MDLAGQFMDLSYEGKLLEQAWNPIADYWFSAWRTPKARYLPRTCLITKERVSPRLYLFGMIRLIRRTPWA